MTYAVVSQYNLDTDEHNSYTPVIPQQGEYVPRKPESAEVLEALIRERGCPQFASFTYTKEPKGALLTREVARHVIILGASLKTLYERDVEALRALTSTLTGLNLQAAMALLESREESLSVGIGNNSKATSADSYLSIADCPGLKVHMATGDVHVMGLKVSKVVLKEGEYRPVNSKPLTLAKKEIEKLLPSSRLRQFNLGNRTTVKIQGQTLEF